MDMTHWLTGASSWAFEVAKKGVFLPSDIILQNSLKIIKLAVFACSLELNAGQVAGQMANLRVYA